MTLYGAPIKPDFDPDSCNILEVSVTPIGIELQWPSAPVHCQSIGGEVGEDYEVDRIDVFPSPSQTQVTRVL